MTESGDLVVHDLDEFAERLENPTPEQAEAIASALAGGELEAWLEVRWDPPEQVPQMVERLRALQQRVGKRPGLACYALRNLLDPDEPLPLLPGVALVRPEDIAAVLDEAPQERRLRLEALQGRIEGGYVEEWLRAREASQAEQTLALLQDSARRYPREPLLPAHVFRWIYAPGGGVPFMGQEVNDPRQLAALIDSSKASRQGGQELLRSGWLRQWLLATGRLKDPRPLDRVLDDERLPQEGKLESVLHLLDTSLAWPKVECEPKELDFGKVRVGETVERTLRVRKSGRGYLWGGLQVNGASGVILDRNDFQGEDTEITVSARPNALMAGSRKEGGITVTTADNVTTTLPWRYKAVSAEQPSRNWVFIGVIVLVVSLLFASLSGQHERAPASQVVKQVEQPLLDPPPRVAQEKTPQQLCMQSWLISMTGWLNKMVCEDKELMELNRRDLAMHEERIKVEGESRRIKIEGDRKNLELVMGLCPINANQKTKRDCVEQMLRHDIELLTGLIGYR